MIKWNQFTLGNEITSKCKQYKLVNTTVGFDFYINNKLVTTFKIKKINTAQKKANEYISQKEKKNTKVIKTKQTANTTKVPKYVVEACEISELYTVLENISIDDNNKIEDYTQEKILHQAKYVLSCYKESGHMLNEELHSDEKEIKTQAKKQIKKLEKYIEKYSKAV